MHGTQTQSTACVRYHQPTVRTGQAMVHLVRRAAAIHQYWDGAQRRDRDERDQPVWAVGEYQPDEFASLQAFYSTQMLGQPCGPSEYFPIGDPFLAQHGQHFAVVHARRRVEFRQRLRSQLEHATAGATHGGIDKLERSPGSGKVGEHCWPVSMASE